MTLSEQLHHVQLCKFFWSCGGGCTKGDCCAFAHQLHQLREPTQEFLQSHKTRKFHMWSEGDILPDRHHVCETIAWAIWDLQQGLAPPEWVYKLHFHATLKYGDAYLHDVSSILGKLGDVPDDAQCPESTSPGMKRKRSPSPPWHQHEGELQGQHPKKPYHDQCSNDRVIIKGPQHPPGPPPAHLLLQLLLQRSEGEGNAS